MYYSFQSRKIARVCYSKQLLLNPNNAKTLNLAMSRCLFIGIQFLNTSYMYVTKLMQFHWVTFKICQIVLVSCQRLVQL